MNDLTTQQAGSFIVNTMEAKDLKDGRRIVNVLENAEAMSELINVEFYIMEIVQKYDEQLNKETGCIEPVIVSTIVTETGKAYASNSGAIARSLQTVLSMLASMGVTKLKKGDLKATIKSKPTKNGKGNYNSLYIFED